MTNVLWCQCSVLNADSSDPLSVSMTGIDTELRRCVTLQSTAVNLWQPWPSLTYMTSITHPMLVASVDLLQTRSSTQPSAQ